MTDRDASGQDDERVNWEYWSRPTAHDELINDLARQLSSGSPSVGHGRIPRPILEQLSTEQLIAALDRSWYQYESSFAGEKTKYASIPDEIAGWELRREDFDNFERELGDKVRLLRTDRGWSQEDLVKQLEHVGFAMHQTTIAKLEAARRPIRISEACALAYVFGLPLDALWSIPLPSEPPTVAKMREKFDNINRDIARIEEDLQLLSYDLRELRSQKAYLAMDMFEGVREAMLGSTDERISEHLRYLGLVDPKTLETSDLRTEIAGRQRPKIANYLAEYDRAKRILIRLESFEAAGELPDVTNWGQERTAILREFDRAVLSAQHAWIEIRKSDLRKATEA